MFAFLYAMLAELRELGYAVLKKLADGSTQWFFFADPKTKNPKHENPKQAFCDAYKRNKEQEIKEKPQTPPVTDAEPVECSGDFFNNKEILIDIPNLDKYFSLLVNKLSNLLSYTFCNNKFVLTIKKSIKDDMNKVKISISLINNINRITDSAFEQLLEIVDTAPTKNSKSFVSIS